MCDMYFSSCRSHISNLSMFFPPIFGTSTKYPDTSSNKKGHTVQECWHRVHNRNGVHNFCSSPLQYMLQKLCRNSWTPSIWQIFLKGTYCNLMIPFYCCIFLSGNSNNSSNPPNPRTFRLGRGSNACASKHPFSRLDIFCIDVWHLSHHLSCSSVRPSTCGRSYQQCCRLQVCSGSKLNQLKT